MAKHNKTQGIELHHDSYLVIGDIHGCYDEMLSLVQNEVGAGRHVVCVGDLIDKGPRPHRCLETALLLGWTVVKGNHEEMHLRYAAHEDRRQATGKKNPMKRPSEFKEQHRKIRASSLNLIGFMKRFPDYVFLPGMGPHLEGVYVIHGGLLPGRTPENMDAKKLCRVRNVHEDGRFANLDECMADPTLPFWTEYYTGEDWILYGHAPFKNPNINGRTIGLDTGCVYGNHLTGLLLPEWRFVQVGAFKAYQKKEKWG